MASYTGMSNLQNRPHRSGFDIGRKNAFTAKVGELLPVYWDISIPGDKYRFNVEYFTRTQPVETSAYTRLREYFDFYAVPLRLLWKSAPSVLTQMQDINQIQALSLTQNLSLGTYLPSVSLTVLGDAMYRLNGSSWTPGNSTSRLNLFGFHRSDLAFKLLSYLGYGNLISTATTGRWWSTSLSSDIANSYTQQYIQNNYVNLFPLLAYQKIYQDFFRWSQWEKSNPSSYNVDYFTGVNPSLISSMPVAPEFDSTEQLRVEIDDTDESRPVRYTSDVRLILHNKDLASRAGISVASKFGQSKQSTSQIQQIMDTMSDEDLLATVRSRYVQSPSEIIAWSKELSAYAENLESEAQALIEAEIAKQEEEKAAAAAAESSESSSE
jgi:hypothetical protein